MWYPHHDLSWEGTIFMLITMIVFWGGLIALGIWLFRSYVGPTARGRPDTEDYDRPSSNVLDILKERYARGEISKAEFEQMRDDLRA